MLLRLLLRLLPVETLLLLRLRLRLRLLLSVPVSLLRLIDAPVTSVRLRAVVPGVLSIIRGGITLLIPTLLTRGREVVYPSGLLLWLDKPVRIVTTTRAIGVLLLLLLPLLLQLRVVWLLVLLIMLLLLVGEIAVESDVVPSALLRLLQLLLLLVVVKVDVQVVSTPAPAAPQVALKGVSLLSVVEMLKE